MTAHHRGALEALHAARPAIARLSTTQGAEDRAADLIEGWSAVETALRSLVGGSAHSGQALIRELRARQVITFDQGNALAEFHTASERARRTDYEPGESDINAAREGFLKLEAGLMAAVAGDSLPPGAATSSASIVSPLGVTAATGSQAAASAGTGQPHAAAAGAGDAPPPAGTRRRAPLEQPWVKGLLGALGLAALIALGWWGYTTWAGNSAIEEAIALYSRGQRQQAAAAFERAARENPRDARPHIYLARMAREAGNMTLARDEATKAVQADTTNPLAYAEMARYLMAAGQWDLARRFWVHTISRDQDDRAAMGYLGCTFIRLGDYNQARTWLQRAGEGEWSVCARQLPPPGYPQQQLPPGTYPPGGQPGQPGPYPYPPAGSPQAQPPRTP